MQNSRVSDPYSFFTDPDPDPDPEDPDVGQYGSGYGSGSGSNPDPGLSWPKIERKKNSWKKKLTFFWSKTAIYLSLGLHKVCPGYRRSLQLTKEAIQHFKTWIFSTFVGHFCPPGSGSGSVFKLRIRIQWSDWIRIQYGSGSETLQNSVPCDIISQFYLHLHYLAAQCSPLCYVSHSSLE